MMENLCLTRNMQRIDFRLLDIIALTSDAVSVIIISAEYKGGLRCE